MNQSLSKLTLFSLLLLGVATWSAFKPHEKLADIEIARLKYGGGGDWYANKSSLPNLIKFYNAQFGNVLKTDEAVVEPSSPSIFNYPFVHMTGHGNFTFTDGEADNLRTYLIGGGFLHIDDNYGLDPFVRPQMKKVFPELDFVELPFDHPVYNQRFKFAKGLPKIHEHEGKSPQGFGLIYQGRVVCFYSFECDLGNGWEDAGTYNDSEETRQQALRMGNNLLQYAFTN